MKKKVFRVRKEIFPSGDFSMLSLIATRLHNEFKPVDKGISFTVSGNASGSRLEVEMVESAQLLKFIKHMASKYRQDLKPYFSKRVSK